MLSISHCNRIKSNFGEASNVKTRKPSHIVLFKSWDTFVVMQFDSVNIFQPINEHLHYFSNGENQASRDVNNYSFFSRCADQKSMTSENVLLCEFVQVRIGRGWKRDSFRMKNILENRKTKEIQCTQIKWGGGGGGTYK